MKKGLWMGLMAIAALGLIFSSAAFGADIELAKKSTVEKILKRGELRVGFESGYVPFEMTDTTGKFIGFDMDFGRRLAKAMGVDEVPPVLAARLEWFQPAEFELEKTVKQLKLKTKADKRELLELIVSIQEADEVLALEEDAYLKSVAEALCLPPEDYEDLAIQDLEFEPRRDSILMPPPLPESPSKRPPPLPGGKQK